MAGSAPRYARAFAEVTQAARLDPNAAEQQLRDFAAALATSRDLREFLDNPAVEMAQKLKVIDALAPRIGMYAQVRNFIAVILDHHRLAELDQIVDEYRSVSDALSGTTEARITSARPLDQVSRAELERQITTLSGGPIRVSYTEDPALLGGAVIEMGSTVYDGSLKTQLDQLKHKLVNA